MLCALTVRRLKPGTFDQFREAFAVPREAAPGKWVRFNMARDGDRVVTFGFFDGDLAELEASQAEHGYEERRAAADEFVDEVLVNGVFEIAVDWSA